MLNLERMEYVWKEIQEKKTVYVDQLAKKYYVSPSTIRRDLGELEKQGLIRRTYGGGILVEKESSEIPYQVRKNEKRDAKDAISRLGADLVGDGMYISMDTTTTVASIVRHLQSKTDLKIITTSAQTALECLDHLTAQIYCTGGWMSSISRGFTGEAARSRLEEFYTDFLFLSGRSVSMDKCLMDVNEEDVFLKQTMIKNTRHTVLLCDSSKMNTYSYRQVCNWSQIEYMITEKKPSEDWLSTLSEFGVKVLYPGIENCELHKL